MGDFDFLGDFNPATEPENPGSVCLPDGDYAATVKSAQINPTKAGDGEYLEVSVRLDGGVVVYDRINVRNRSEAATKIGRATFGALCRATGFGSRPPGSAAELVGRECVVTLGHEEYMGEMKNRVRTYKPKPSIAPVAARNPWGV